MRFDNHLEQAKQIADSVEDIHGVFLLNGIGRRAEEKLHKQVWEALLAGKNLGEYQIEVHSRGRAHMWEGKRCGGYVETGPIPFRVEWEDKKHISLVGGKEEAEVTAYIRSDVSWDGYLEVYIDGKCKVSKHGNRIYVTKRGCF